jgi:AraC-like DNA-binding protein
LIRNRLRNPPGNPELALAAGCSVGHFARLFESDTGVSPKRFAQRARVERAKELLRDLSWSVSAIAASIGYDLPSFTKFFKATTGLTPTEFRARN